MDKKTTKQPRRFRTALIAITVAVSGVGVGGYVLASGMTQPETVETVETVGKFAPTPVETVKPTPIETPTQAPASEPAPVVQSPAPPPVDPSKCPAGTTAGQVDAAGNESNCQPTNNGQPCVAYNDANECTQWYKP